MSEHAKLFRKANACVVKQHMQVQLS